MAKEIKWEKVIRSKTLWVNLIALVALVTQLEYGFVVAPGEQASAIVVINLILRIITKEGLFEDTE